MKAITMEVSFSRYFNKEHAVILMERKSRYVYKKNTSYTPAEKRGSE